MIQLIIRFSPISIGSMMFWFGELDFVESFFNTVCYRLENRKWGSRFPRLMVDLFDGKVKYENIDEFEIEISTVENELKNFKIQQVVYDLNDPSVEPPWHQSGISDELTNLSDYWVTSDGKKLFRNFHMAIGESKRLKQPLFLASSHDDVLTLV